MDIRPETATVDATHPPQDMPSAGKSPRPRHQLIIAYTAFVLVCLGVGAWSVIVGSEPRWRPLLWGVGGFGAAAFYVLPATMALLTRHSSKDRIVAFNITLGWIPIVWVACLVWVRRNALPATTDRPALTAAKTTPTISDPEPDSALNVEVRSTSQELARVVSPITPDPESELLPLIPIQRMSNPFELPDPVSTRELMCQATSTGRAPSKAEEHLAAAQARVQRRQLTGGPRYALQPAPTPAEKWMESIAAKAETNSPTTSTDDVRTPVAPSLPVGKPAPDPASIVDLAPPS